jgi:glycerol uptake facilitator-like aquaporin
MSTFQTSITPDYFIPLLVSVTFYAAVFALAEISRRIVDHFISPKRHIYAFFMELAASAQMCTCIYENGVILKNYGVIGFFFTVIGLLIAGGYANRGAFVNPLPVIELAYKNVISIERTFVLLTAQIIGGGLAFRIAEEIWYLTMDLVGDHQYFYENLPCTFTFKHSLMIAMIYEVIGCFALRFIGGKLPGRAKGYLMPAMVSFLLSVAFVYIGVPALNPLTVSARMMKCKGLDQEMFFITYWGLPLVGWFAAVFLDDWLSQRRPTVQKQAPKQQKKQTAAEKKKWFSGKKKQH